MKKILLIVSLFISSSAVKADTCTDTCDKALVACKKNPYGYVDVNKCIQEWQNCKKNCSKCASPCEDLYNRCRGGFSSARQCAEKRDKCLQECKNIQE